MRRCYVCMRFSIMSRAFCKSILYWWGKEAKRAGCEGHRRHCIWMDSDFRPQVKTDGPGIWIGVEANTIGLHFCFICFVSATLYCHFSENRTAQFAEFYKIVLHTFKFLVHTLCSKTHYFRPWWGTAVVHLITPANQLAATSEIIRTFAFDRITETIYN